MAPAELGAESTPFVRTRAPALVSGSIALLLIATASLTATAALRPPDNLQAEEPPAEINWKRLPFLLTPPAMYRTRLLGRLTLQLRW